jgi:hypothetical protein
MGFKPETTKEEVSGIPFQDGRITLPLEPIAS